MKQEVSALKKWLANNNGAAMKMATIFGYETPQAITMWVRRNKIPHYRVTQVKEMIDGYNAKSGKHGKN